MKHFDQFIFKPLLVLALYSFWGLNTVLAREEQEKLPVTTSEVGINPGEEDKSSSLEKVEMDTIPAHLHKIEFPVETGFHSMFEDSDGFIWFGTEDGVFRYDNYTVTEYVNSPRYERIDSILEDRDKNLIFYRREEAVAKLKNSRKIDPYDPFDFEISLPVVWNPGGKGLFSEKVIIRPDTSLVIPGNPKPFKLPALLFNRIACASTIPGNYSEVLIGGTKGEIFKLNLITGTWTQFKVPVNERIDQVLWDRSGGIWMMSRRSVWLVQAREQLFESKFSGNDLDVWEIRKKDNSEKEILVLASNSLGSEIIHIDITQDGRIEILKTIKSKIPYKTIYELNEDRYLAGGSKNRFFIQLPDTQVSIPSAGTEIAIFQHLIPLDKSRSKFLVAAGDEGLYCWDQNKDRVQKIQVADNKFEPFLKGAYYILPDPSRKDWYWVGSLINDLLHIKISGTRADSLDRHPISVLIQDETSLRNENYAGVISFAFDNENPNVIWIGTYGKGLYKYDYINRKMLKRFTFAEHMLSGKVYSIEPYGNHLFVYTQKGLCCLYKKEIPSFFGISDGLPELDGAGTSSLLWYDDILVFGTNNGLVKFHAKALINSLVLRFGSTSYSPFPPNLVIIRNGKTEDFGKSELTISKDDYLELIVSSQNYNYRDILTYRYAWIGEGIKDTVWHGINGGERTMLKFPPRNTSGKLTLIVQVSGPSEWKHTAKKITFHVVRDIPWWRMSTFILVGLLFLLTWFLLVVIHEYKQAEQNEFHRISMSDDYLSRDTEDAIRVHLEPFLGCKKNEYTFAVLRKDGNHFQLGRYFKNGSWEDRSTLKEIEIPVNENKLAKGKPIIVRKQDKRPENHNDDFDLRYRPIICQPVMKNGQCIFIVCLQFDVNYLKFMTLAGRLKEIAGYGFPKNYLDKYNAVTKRAKVFFERLEKTGQAWKNNYPTEPFHVPTDNPRNKDRYPWYSLVDNLLSWSPEKTDEVFHLKDTEGNYPGNTILEEIDKGLWEKSISPVSLYLSMMGAVSACNNGRENVENNFEKQLSNIYQYDYTEAVRGRDDSFNLKYESAQSGDVLQAAYQLCASLYFNDRAQKLNPLVVKWIHLSRDEGGAPVIIGFELNFTLGKENIKKLKMAYDGVRVSGKGGSGTAKALREFEGSLAEGKLKYEWDNDEGADGFLSIKINC